LLTVAAGAVLASSVFVLSADAAPGDLTFAGCIGDLAGCTATNPATALEGGQGVAVDGLQLYSVSSAAVSHFTLDTAGNANFAGCIGIQPGCTPAPFIGANAVTVTPDGKQLYTTTEEYVGGAVSHYTIDAAGNLTFAGCIGRITSASCTPTFPPGALDGAEGVAVTADGKQLYATSEQGNVVSHFRIDGAGNLIFAGCIGDLAGCTSTNPASVLDDATNVIVTPDGKQLYAASASYHGSAISHFIIDAAGNLTFAGCIGTESGCTPNGTLGWTYRLAVTPDGAHLYATSGTTSGTRAVSHFRIDAAGNLISAGCIGDLAGCTATTPKTALDYVDGLIVSGVGGDLYATAGIGASGAVSHFKIVGAGNLIFASCIGDLAGCTATTPKTVLDGADGVAVSNDGANLYATSFFGNSVSHFTIAAFTFSR
jgi:DNA-binding beta-propeller fold protein YncE